MKETRRGTPIQVMFISNYVGTEPERRDIWMPKGLFDDSGGDNKSGIVRTMGEKLLSKRSRRKERRPIVSSGKAGDKRVYLYSTAWVVSKKDEGIKNRR